MGYVRLRTGILSHTRCQSIRRNSVAAVPWRPEFHDPQYSLRIRGDLYFLATRICYVTMEKKRTTVVAISGFSSNVGKTTLMCELLRRLPGWEAIKLTRGHYRSCGRDPAGCCGSDLLRDEPVIRSGREANYHTGKDTARFWDAGASNVHWVIVKDGQVESGINAALTRVKCEGVVIEGNSFLDFVTPDLTMMCARSD